MASAKTPAAPPGALPAIPVAPEAPASAPQAAAALSATVPTVEAALRTLVEQFHRRNCNHPRWETCRNPECVAVQKVIK